MQQPMELEMQQPQIQETWRPTRKLLATFLLAVLGLVAVVCLFDSGPCLEFLSEFPSKCDALEHIHCSVEHREVCFVRLTDHHLNQSFLSLACFRS